MKPTLPNGTMVSHYRIVEPLGAGGMGEVYKAFDSRLERFVALKILPAHLLRDPDRIHRFVREAKAASALNHPHVLTVHEIGETTIDGSGPIHFIAMEFIDGETLRNSIAGKTDFRKMIVYLSQVADGLAKAHAVGIIHRDLKPENIMIARDGYAKVLDFGLAKLQETDRPLAEALSKAPTDLIDTEPGVILGTVGYMSPEQVQGKPVDQRSDIFSFGVILYEVTTARQPFRGNSTIDTLHKIAYDPAPPIQDYTPDAPAELQRILRKALAKDPEERYQSIREVALDLRDLKKELDSGAVAFRQRLPRPSKSLLLGIPTALLVIIFGGFFLYRQLAEKNLPAASQDHGPMKISRLTGRGVVFGATISPDGKYVAYSPYDAGKSSIWIKQIATESETQILPPSDEEFLSFTFTPDGNFIYYTRIEGSQGWHRGELHRIPALGGIPTKIAEDVQRNVRPTFSPSGDRFAFTRLDVKKDPIESQLVVANADGSAERKLITKRYPERVGQPAWSPDGKQIAYIGGELGPEGFRQRIVGLDLESLAARPLSAFWRRISSIDWYADGRGLVVLAKENDENPSQVWEVSYPSGLIRKITNDLNNYSQLTISRTNDLVTTQWNFLAGVWIASVTDGATPKPITFSPGAYHGVRWAAGGQIVYQLSHDIWIMGPDGSNPRPLTSNARQNWFPAVTKDGRYVIFESNRSGKFNIWRVDIDGRNPKQLTNHEHARFADCTPDGRWVIYTNNDTGTGMLWKVPIDGGSAFPISTRTQVGPAVSPDGRMVSCSQYVEDRGTTEELAVLSLETGTVLKTFPLPLDAEEAFFRWTIDGKGIAYPRTQGGVSNIWIQPLEGGPPKQVTRFESDFIVSFDWSPDGRRLAVARGTWAQDLVLLQNFRVPTTK